MRIDRYLRAPYFEQDNGGGGGGGGQQQQQQGPWHAGLEPEILGHAQNKGWSLDDPKAAFAAAAKAARAAEQHIGVPADQLIRLPKDTNDTTGWNSVWSRLGKPADAKEYDFSGVKNAAGEEIPAALADAIRASAFEAHLPKDAAAKMAESVVKHMDGVTAASNAEQTTKLTAEKTALAQSWGKNAEYNMVMAKKGAERLGLDPEAVSALESVVGYSKTLEALRRVGQNTSEDTFIEGGQGNNKGPMTIEAAKARKAELINDKSWGKRWMDGDREARTEMQNLDLIIAGAAA